MKNDITDDDSNRATEHRTTEESIGLVAFPDGNSIGMRFDSSCGKLEIIPLLVVIHPIFS
jgi:hypothetical protein